MLSLRSRVENERSASLEFLSSLAANGVSLQLLELPPPC